MFFAKLDFSLFRGPLCAPSFYRGRPARRLFSSQVRKEGNLPGRSLNCTNNTEPACAPRVKLFRRASAAAPAGAAINGGDRPASNRIRPDAQSRPGGVNSRGTIKIFPPFAGTSAGEYMQAPGLAQSRSGASAGSATKFNPDLRGRITREAAKARS